MNIKYYIMVLVLIMYSGMSLANNYSQKDVMLLTKGFIESLEWDPFFHKKIEEYRKYKKIYNQALSSHVENEVFVSIVMLGLLREKQSLSKIENVQESSDLIKTGKSFAICMLNKNCATEKKYLYHAGAEIYDVAGATSLKNLYAIELLSLLKYPDYKDYVSKLKTDEAFQKEALTVAVMRYNNILKTNTK